VSKIYEFHFLMTMQAARHWLVMMAKHPCLAVNPSIPRAAVAQSDASAHPIILQGYAPLTPCQPFQLSCLTGQRARSKIV
jgi:hypothetical protein